jgi:hypothetical protein
MIEHLTLLLPQQSPLTFPVGLAVGALLGGIIGVVFAGLMKYAMDQKNNLRQAYSQLIGKKFVITAIYMNFLEIALFVYSNIGKKNEAENYDTPDKEKQIQKLDRDNEDNIHKYEKLGLDLIKDMESFWKIIGVISSINSSRKDDEIEDKLIEDIRLKQISLDKMQKEWIKETKKGLPDSKPDANGLLVSHWQDKNRCELELRIELFENAIDLLIEYVKKNKINKHWFEFLW